MLVVYDDFFTVNFFSSNDRDSNPPKSEKSSPKDRRMSDRDLNNVFEEPKSDSFSEYQQKSAADNDELKRDPLFRGFRAFRDDVDPLRAREAPPRTPLSEMAKQVRNKTDSIRQNWNDAQFLSDYGRPDRPSSEVKVINFFFFFLFLLRSQSKHLILKRCCLPDGADRILSLMLQRYDLNPHHVSP